jgi:hypothetical protein
MRLVSIINCWDDWEWLEKVVKNQERLVDGFIIVASEKSNYGEISPIPDAWRSKVHIREPFFNHPMNCETDKRNFGLSIAKKEGYTHFLACDCDELYEPEEFLRAKERFLNEDLKGLVCRTKVYFGYPSLTIGFDTTLVPFIHKLTPDLRHEFNRKYPYAWDQGKIFIDPTRSLNINSGVKMDDIVMHHYSWCRGNYEKKIRNSTARNNIQKSTILEDLKNAVPGYHCKFYNKVLYEDVNKLAYKY